MPAVTATLDLSSYKSYLDPADFKRFIKGFAIDLLTYTMLGTPVDTGRLAKNWRTRISGSTVTIYNNTPYASYVEEGNGTTIPHPGFKMLANALRLRTKIADALLNKYRKKRRNTVIGI